MKMFEDIADKLFDLAALPIKGNEHVHQEVVVILAQKMAELSVVYGLTQERIKIFDDQKKSLLENLIIYKEKINE